MEYKLSEQELQDLMHRTWLKAKSFYKGQTDEYFYEHFERERKQLNIYGVVFNEAKIINKQLQAKLIEQIMKADEELGLYSEVELFCMVCKGKNIKHHPEEYYECLQCGHEFTK